MFVRHHTEQKIGVVLCAQHHLVEDRTRKYEVLNLVSKVYALTKGF